VQLTNALEIEQFAELLAQRGAGLMPLAGHSA
jgi:hypothetical protein